MTKRINSTHKVDRRLGVNLWGRPKSPFNTRAYRPGQHGHMSERQFRNLFRKAYKKKGDTGENLVGLLERRLDAVIYRAKFAITVFAARQMINHGKVKVNGKKVNISSYLVSENDEIEIKDSFKQSIPIIGATQSKEREVPEYIIADHKKMTAKFNKVPKYDQIPYPVQMEPKLVVEYYSR
ncbi:MAG: 30S ribosomal protein S4 [Candidatus Fonsibacter ubiquis]|nr:30S ribosomal protein S4 [Candidatus Fonsibacter ubiquis]